MRFFLNLSIAIPLMFCLFASGVDQTAAQDYVLINSSMAAGGGRTSSNRFELDSSFGQPDSGESTGGQYLVTGGFQAQETTTVLLGDVNLDGSVNLLDVSPFVELLINGQYQLEADINEDGSVDLLDVSPFVELLSG